MPVATIARSGVADEWSLRWAALYGPWALFVGGVILVVAALVLHRSDAVTVCCDHRRHRLLRGGSGPTEGEGFVFRAVHRRTGDALAAKKAQGVHLGRPRQLPADIIDRIRTAHDAGAGWSAIARDLNAVGVPTAHGGARWYPATVRYVVLGASTHDT